MERNLISDGVARANSGVSCTKPMRYYPCIILMKHIYYKNRNVSDKHCVRKQEILFKEHLNDIREFIL